MKVRREILFLFLLLSLCGCEEGMMLSEPVIDTTTSITEPPAEVWEAMGSVLVEIWLVLFGAGRT